MDKKILEAYEYLVPVDQLVIDAMVISLFKKDKQIGELVKELTSSLVEKE